MKQIIVTVGREHGSGGKYIAEQIAKQLGIAFYDKELLLASVFNAEDAARYDEKPVHLLWSRRIGENFNAPEDALARETFEHIQELADSGESFVVLGRCSDYVLRANPNAVHLFIAGKPDVKRRRLMEEKSLTADQAALEIRPRPQGLPQLLLRHEVGRCARLRPRRQQRQARHRENRRHARGLRACLSGEKRNRINHAAPRMPDIWGVFAFASRCRRKQFLTNRQRGYMMA